MKRTDKKAIFNLRIYDPIGYEELLSSFGNTPLAMVEKEYGKKVAEDTRQYFIDHPSVRFNQIMGGA